MPPLAELKLLVSDGGRLLSQERDSGQEGNFAQEINLSYRKTLRLAYLMLITKRKLSISMAHSGKGVAKGMERG